VIDLLIPESGSLLNTPNSLKSKHSKISHPGAEPSIIKATLPSSAIHDTAKISVANIGGTASTFNPAPDTCPPHTPAQSLNAKAPRQIATPLTSAPITSDTEKKRKRTRVDEFKTIDNPPLNQDCVIAFAESADGETAVLRQVKCEKPGVFTEDMIVCGMRFFIAG
jgi:hypothetical protein